MHALYAVADLGTMVKVELRNDYGGTGEYSYPSFTGRLDAMDEGGVALREVTQHSVYGQQDQLDAIYFPWQAVLYVTPYNAPASPAETMSEAEEEEDAEQAHLQALADNPPCSTCGGRGCPHCNGTGVR